MRPLLVMLVFSILIFQKLTAQTPPETVIIKDWKRQQDFLLRDNDSMQYLRCIAIKTAPLIDTSLWHHFLRWNLAPDTFTAKKIPAGVYTLQVSYIINKYGCLVEAQCLTKTSSPLDSFVTNKLNQCPYTWSPATQNGRAVISRQFVNLVFDISSAPMFVADQHH